MHSHLPNRIVRHFAFYLKKKLPGSQNQTNALKRPEKFLTDGNAKLFFCLINLIFTILELHDNSVVQWETILTDLLNKMSSFTEIIRKITQIYSTTTNDDKIDR